MDRNFSLSVFRDFFFFSLLQHSNENLLVRGTIWFCKNHLWWKCKNETCKRVKYSVNVFSRHTKWVSLAFWILCLSLLIQEESPYCSNLLRSVAAKRSNAGSGEVMSIWLLGIDLKTTLLFYQYKHIVHIFRDRCWVVENIKVYLYSSALTTHLQEV